MHEEMRPVPESWDDYSWAQLIRAVVNYTAQPGENVDDIVVGGWRLGERRARLFERKLEIWQDVPFGLSIFCYWPFKPPISNENIYYLMENRWSLFKDVCRETKLAEKLAKSVPDWLYLKTMDDMFFELQNSRIAEIIDFNIDMEKENRGVFPYNEYDQGGTS